MATDKTGRLGVTQLGEGRFRAMHSKLGIKAYGRTEVDAVRHLADAMETHTEEVQ